MEIVYKKVNELIPYINNSRTHSEEQVNQIVASINEFGFTNPILIDEKDNIIAGHGRLLASKKLKMEEVPCIVLKGLTEAQKKAYIIADNKMALNAGWDEELLKIELENLKELDFDLELTGFNVDELDDILGTEEEKEVVEDDFEIEVPEEPKAKLGDIYQLGSHRLMCGDSTKEEDVAKLMNGVKADMVFTDPPYGANMGIIGDIGEEYKKIFEGFYNCIPCKDNIYICCDWRCIDSFCQTIKLKHKIYNLIVWVKNLFGQGKLYHTKHEEIIFCGEGNYNKKNLNNDVNVWEADSVRNFAGSKNAKEAVGHPTQKPIEICARAIKNSSNENENIYDGFGGSGSTLIACEQLNRKCYMMELDPHYVDVIIQRWENFTGKKAVKLN
ncbi:MAG: DNA methyltransferase [Treponema sp.]|nr:DNA methyltransferase [Treponema sp.]MDY5852716.1 DNA methyltransferase [Bacilli bacterium]